MERQIPSLYGVLDHLIEGCQIITPDWRYLYVNNALVQQGRKTRDELLGRTMMECYPGIDGAPFFTILRKTMEERVPGEMENEFTFPDGSTGWFDLRFEPVPEGVFILSLECTQRKRAEEQMRQAQKMEAVGRLAGGVAHDFNNILTVILLYTNKLLGTMRPADPGRGAVEQIKKAGERAASLTGQLLAFSRQQVLEPKILDLNAVVSGVEKMLHRLIGEDVTLTTILDPKLGRVKADPGQIDQVILNLVVNARDAMPRGGALTLETRNVDLDASYARQHAEIQPGPHVMLAVSDTGHGMDRATQARIFEPFFTTKEAGKGTGLGLATVFGIIKQSNGSIWVYSEPGQGTAFKIYLPQVTDGSSLEEPWAEKAPPEGSETILLVEDDELVREITESSLQDLGYTVLTARNGQEALELFRKHGDSVHMLVSDVVMPGMGGPKVAEAIQAQHPGIRVMFLSGYTDDTIVRHGIVQGEIAFLQKPFTIEALATKVRETLARP